MGHALNGVRAGHAVRYHRMLGERAKWILGTDHAGIATQKQVESRSQEEGTSARRSAARPSSQRVWEWREQYGGTIIEQFKRLGASLRLRATSASRWTSATSKAVQKVFVDLYDKGLIYRDNYMVNWDPGSRSAISDLEVEEREVEDTLFHIAYPLERRRGRGRGRDRAPRDDAGRHRRRGASRRRALRAPRRRARRSCRWSAAACRSSPTSTSSPSSAPAR